jgi:hypothetical protein
MPPDSSFGSISGDLEIVDQFSKTFTDLMRQMVTAQNELAATQGDTVAVSNAFGSMAKASTIASQEMAAAGEKAAAGIKKIPTEMNAATTITSKAADLLKNSFVQAFGAFTAVGIISDGMRMLKNLGAEAVASSGHLLDLSHSTHLSTDTLQEMQNVANQTGTSLEKFTDASFKLSVNIQSGTKKVRAAVDELGLSYDALFESSSEEQWKTIITALEGVSNQERRNFLGVQLLNKGYKEIGSAIEEGYTAIAAAASKSSKEQIEALDAAGDAWQQFKDDVANSTRTALGETVIMVKGAIAALDEWEKKQQDLIKNEKRNRQEGKIDLDKTGTGPLGVGSFDVGALASQMKGAKKDTVDFTAELSALREELKDLTSAEREQIDAGLKIGKTHDEIANKVHISADAIALYASEQKDATTASKKLTEEAKKLLDTISGAKATKDIKDLQAAWTSLTAGQKSNKTVIKEVLDEYEKLRAKVGGEVSPTLEKLYRTEGQVTGAHQLETRALMFVGQELKTYTDQTQKTSNAIQGLTKDGELLSHWMSDEGVMALAEMGRHFETFGAQTRNVEKDLVTFGDTLKTHLTGALKSIPGIVANGIINDASWEQIGTALVSTIGSAIGGALGEAFGGPIGEAIGSAAGSMLGMVVDALHHSAGEDVMQRVGRVWGASITEGMGDQIARDAKNLFRGNRQAAELFNMDEIIGAAGGVNADNLDVLTGKLHDVFSMMDTHFFTAAQGARVLDENFGKFAAYFEGGRISKELQEIVRLTQEAGTNSKAVAEFLRQQSGTTTKGFAGIEAGFMGGLPKDKEGKITGAPSQEDFDRISRLAVAAFGQAIAAGEPFLEVLGSMKDQLGDLGSLAGQFGLAQSQAFGDLSAIQAFMETNKGVSESITGVQQMLQGLYNSNALTEQTFVDLGDSALANFNKMIAGGR